MRADPGVFCLKPRGSPPSREGLGVMTEPAVNRTRLVPHLRRLPGGDLHTLRDAATYITKLPEREHDAPAWRVAIQALILVAEHGGDTMMPRIGIMMRVVSGRRRPLPRRCRWSRQ